MQAFDRLFALLAIVVLLPLMLPICALVRWTMGPPVLFRQTRVGLGGTPFQIIKFRSMKNEPGPQLTSSGDPRITRLGRFLRRWKLDELPELWNVVRGEMALVGPRPEVPPYVDLADPNWVEVLAIRPGLTHPVTLSLHNEESLLAKADDPDHFYRNVLLPEKLRGYLEYDEQRSFATDIGVLLATVTGSLSRSRSR